MTDASVREFKMPDVGEGLTEAEILKWYVQPGDTVTDGQVVCEVETAKAAVELPIPYDGVVRALHFPEGTTVDVGTPIIAVEVGGGPAAPAPASEAPAQEAPQNTPQETSQAEGSGRQPVLVGYGVATSSTRRRPRKPAAPGPEVPQQAVQAELNGHGTTPPAPTEPAAPATPAVPAPAQPAPTAAGGARPLAKPPVRKLAKDLGVDLTTVTPSGEGGVVTRADVASAVGGGTATAAAGAPAYAPAPGQRETRIPVKGVRKMTAQAMVASAFTAPHVTEWVTIDVTRTMDLVAKLKKDRDFADVKVSPLLLVAKALVLAVKRNPEINAVWDEAAQEIVVKHYVNLGIAAATPRGLVVPNIKDADRMSLLELAEALQALTATAREGRTQPADMAGGTMTITNVGVFGVDAGTPILNPGEAAILCFGQVRDMPWVVDGEVVVRKVTQLALSFDHRVADGQLGSMFLADIARVLEDPATALLW
jgi:pyruvate dehydrogenase E2 component (dihydrolipoamide acetyltransferase)